GLEVLAEQTPSPEGREQCQAADDRREDEGDEDEGAEGGLPGPARTGEEDRQRRAEEDAEEGRDRRGAQREQQRGDRGLRAQARAELPDVDRADQAEQRDDDDQDGTGRRKPQPAWWGHGAPKPWSSRTLRPSGPVTYSTNARASSVDSLSASAAIG